MSMLTDFNQGAAAFLPPGTWDVLEIVLGVSVFIATFIQRACSDRFRISLIACRLDAVTTRIGHLGLWAVATLSALVAIDGALPGDAPPRSFVVLFLAGYLAIQVRVIYQATARSLSALYHRLR